MTDLLPCPFCATILRPEIGCYVHPHTGCLLTMVGEYHLEDYEVEIWNARASQTVTSEEVAEAANIVQRHFDRMRGYRNDNADYSLEDRALETLIRAATASATVREVKAVTLDQFSQEIQKWKFSDSFDGSFGEYLMNVYPYGLRIVSGKE